MKKLILVLVVILVSTNTLHATKFNWSDGMITVDSKTKFFIDKKSIKKINNYIYYWSLANYLILEEDDDPDIKSFISYHRLDCNDMGYQIIIFIAFSDYDGEGKTLGHYIDPDTEEEKRFNDKLSIAYKRHLKLCN